MSRIKRLVQAAVKDYMDNHADISEMVEAAVESYLEDNIETLVEQALEE